MAVNHKCGRRRVYRPLKLDYGQFFRGLGPAMIRTVWLAIACLVALAGLSVLKFGTASFVQEAASPSEQAAASVASDTAWSDVLPKGDRLDAADEDDAIKPIRPIAITT